MTVRHQSKAEFTTQPEAIALRAQREQAADVQTLRRPPAH